MSFVIVTGMSGAGKSSVLRMLEDSGYYCVDNLPIPFVPKIAQWVKEENNDKKNVALGIDVRSGAALEDMEEVLGYLDKEQYSYEILYIFGKEIKLVPKFGGDEEVVPLYIKFNKLSNQYVIIISLHRQEYPLIYKFK